MADIPVSSYMKFASDPERWSKLSREGPDVGSLSPSSQASQYSGPNTTRDQWSQPPQPKKGSYTVPKMCAGGKVIKTWR